MQNRKKAGLLSSGTSTRAHTEAVILSPHLSTCLISVAQKADNNNSHKIYNNNNNDSKKKKKKKKTTALADKVSSPSKFATPDEGFPI